MFTFSLRKTVALLGLVAGPFVTLPVLAAPCGTGLDTSNFSLRGSASDVCHGPMPGNPNTLGDFNAALGGVAGIGGDWQVFLSSPAGGSVSTDWNGFRFSFLAEAVAGPSPATGNFWFQVTDLSPGTPPEYPISFDLLVAPKAGNQWASYLFGDEQFLADGTGEMMWRIVFNNNNSPNGTPAGLSHMNFLLRGFEGSECGVGCEPPGDEPCGNACVPINQSVPEPSTLATMLLALAMLAYRRRRRC